MTHFTSKLLASSAIEMYVRLSVCGVVFGSDGRPRAVSSSLARVAASPTTARAGVLTGGWQTDRESTYVALSRARDQTDIYLSREDLGQDGLDPEAIEHLAQLMQQGHAQEATITRDLAQPTSDRSPELAQQTDDRSLDAGQPPDFTADPTHDQHCDTYHQVEVQTRSRAGADPPEREAHRACDSRGVWCRRDPRPCSASNRASPYQPRSSCEGSAPEFELASEGRNARPPLPTRASRTRSEQAVDRPPEYLAPLALVVEGDVDRQTLEVPCGGGLGSPPGVQLCCAGDRRLDRHATLTIRDDLIATPGDLHKLADSQVHSLHGSCHRSMVAARAS